MYLTISMEMKKMNDLISLIDKNETISLRRHIHQNPELSFQEYKTMDFICKKLDEYGIEYNSKIAGTGVLAVIYGEKDSENCKTLLVRADIDALPIEEISDKPYASLNKGIMHACGHDAHTAILLSVCKTLNELKSEFSGCVKLLFQPGEETTGGAKPMIEAGVLENPKVDVCIALHVDPEINSGTIRIKPGPFYASPDDFKIKVVGKSGHAAEPHNHINPISVCAEIISTINNEFSNHDEYVVTVSTVHSGTATNIVPETAEISGTARSLTNETRVFLKDRLNEICNKISSKYKTKYEYEFIELYPPLINDKEIADLFYKTAIKHIGEENCIYGGVPTMTGEDFAYFSQSVPSLLFKLGCRNEETGIVNPLHNASFDIDESCLNTGVTLFCGFALDFLK